MTPLARAIIDRTTTGLHRLTRQPLAAIQVTDATGHEPEPGAEPEPWPEVLADATLVSHLRTRRGVSLYRVEYATGAAVPPCFYLVR